MKQDEIVRLVRLEVLEKPERIMGFIEGLIVSMNELSEEIETEPKISRKLLQSAAVLDKAKTQIYRLLDL